jgi:broad specificity phosphatase PhoE
LSTPENSDSLVRRPERMLRLAPNLLRSEGAEVTTFHLLRHGEPEKFGRINGRLPGVGLSARGRFEINAVAARLAGEKIAAIYSSPLQRTRETAEILADLLGLPIRYRDDVIELDFGAWTGLTADAIRKDERWQAWNTCRSIATIPEGESWRQVQDRVVNALFDLEQTHPDGTVLIISHGDVIRAALLFALGMPLDFYSRIEIAPASISTIRLDGTGIRVLGVNEWPRLPPP